jgi:predicted CXXCH cytochrome family protein
MLASDTVSETCSKCHEASDLVPNPAFAHTPVREGKCEACHNPHASEFPNLLSGPAGGICWSCHEDVKAQTKATVVHRPFEKGQCLDCHLAHGGKADMNLKDEPKTLCIKCHGGDLSGRHGGFVVAGSDCAGCHAPHASTAKGLPHAVSHAPFAAGKCGACHSGKTSALAQPQKTLCLGCHTLLGEQLAEQTPHGPLKGQESCTPCHTPHTAPVASLLPRPQIVVCGQCHEVQATANRDAAHRHPQVRDRNCTTCHDPHLVPAATGKASVAVEVCFNCHTYREHTDHPMGPDVLDPRTGLTMTCNSCHDPHGTAFPKFLRDDPGGKLCVGCHTDKLRAKRG